MARTLTVIQTAIKSQIRTYPSLDDFKFPEDGGSSVSIFNVFVFVVAAAIYTFETMMDIVQSDIQAIADSAPSGNAKWVQRQILNFQYGDIITLTDFVPSYPTLTPANQIITKCSVRTISNGGMQIKVAKGVSPSLAPLSAPELTALLNYWNGTSTQEGVGFAGVKTTFISLYPDRMMVNATVYFQGQYIEATVKAGVVAAIDDFFGSLQDESFDGSVFLIRLVDAIQAVDGVSRVKLNNVTARPETTVFASSTILDVQGVYNTSAGYLISEDTVGYTLNDSITLEAETNG
jgi:hypothetical protein